MRMMVAVSRMRWLLPLCVAGSPFIAFRNHLGVTLRELAARTGIAASYLSEIERGIKPGSTAALSRIADAFGTTLDVLVKLS